MAETIAGVTIPDSKMARETTDFICETESPLLYHHSRRTYLFGMLHGQLRGQARRSGTAVRRGDVPRPRAGRGTSEPRASDSRSTAPMPPAHFLTPTRCRTTTSAGSGRPSPCTPPTASRCSWNPRSRCWQPVSRPTSTAPGWTCWSPTDIKEVVAAHPRLDFKRKSLPTFAAGFKDRPDTTFGAITADVLAHFYPGFKRKDFVEVVQNNALDGVTPPMIPIGIALAPPAPDVANAIDDLVLRAQASPRTGVASLWLGQLFDIDAITAVAVIGREVPDVDLGTAVTITYPRHPIVMSSQAQTAQAAARWPAAARARACRTAN